MDFFKIHWPILLSEKEISDQPLADDNLRGPLYRILLMRVFQECFALRYITANTRPHTKNEQIEDEIAG